MNKNLKSNYTGSIVFNSDGNKSYLVDMNSETVQQYKLTTPFSPRTAYQGGFWKYVLKYFFSRLSIRLNNNPELVEPRYGKAPCGQFEGNEIYHKFITKQKH